MRKRFAAVLFGLLCQFPPALAAAPHTETIYTPEQLRQDFRFLQQAIEHTHPIPDLFASRESLRLAFGKVEQGLQQGLTRDQAWQTLATLNPVFSDAHMQLLHGDWEALSRAHLVAGGALFPFEVQVSAAGEITIREALGGQATPLAGARIEQINGIPARQIVARLLSVMTGDTPALRANLLSRRMWFYYWKLYGSPSEFSLSIVTSKGRGEYRVAASREMPASIALDKDADFARTFQFAILPGNIALLTVNQFLWHEKKAFYAFTAQAFEQIRAAKVSTLIIDVRGNTGGDDDMWKIGILPYIADKPFRNGSSYTKMVIAGRQSGTEQVGDVVHGFGDTWIAPQTTHPLFYSGKTYVLVGRLTYSSAVLFSNVVQDFGFAQLVGEAGYAHTRQTGGVQGFKLPNTGLELTVPRFVLDRPSGVRDPVLVNPDIVLPDSANDRQAMVRALIAYLADQSPAHTMQ